MNSADEISVAKRAFAYLLDAHIAENMQDPVGDYLRSMVQVRMGDKSATVKPEAARAIEPERVPVVTGQPKPTRRGGWTAEAKAKAAATRAISRAKRQAIAGNCP